MSSLTSEQIALIARERANEPLAALPRFVSQVNAGLNELAERIAKNRQLRHWLLTPRATTTVVLVAGVADLTTLISSNKVLLDCLRYGSIYSDDPNFPEPLILVKTIAQLNSGSAYGQMYGRCALEGTKLYTWIDGATLAGNLLLAVPYTPTLAQLPEALVDELVAVIVELCAGKKEVAVAGR